MANQQLLEYIRERLQAGVPRGEIRKQLMISGWMPTDIDEGFGEIDQTSPSKPATAILTTPASVQPTLSATTPHTFSPESPTTRSSSKKKVTLLLSVTLGLLVLGGGVYAYLMKVGPFARPPYSEKNLFSGILASVARINSSSYLISGSLAVSARDADAKPFVAANVSNSQEVLQRYQHDARRMQDVTGILQNLFTKKASYPPSLSGLIDKNNNQYSYYGTTNITDPVSGQSYEYALTENGKNFTLTVIFETTEAISTIKKSYNFSATSTPIEEKKVTFTKNSSSYIYFPTTPPKPLLVQLSDSLSFLPAEVNAKLSASAQTDWGKPDADWKFNINASGDFGDLTYKVDVDALKKSGIYYFKINNIPSLFLGSLAAMKGQWIKVDPSIASSSDDTYSEFSYFSSKLPDVEKSYKEQRKAFTDLIKKVATIADEENLLTLKTPPYSERIDGRVLYRYDLKIHKSAIVPFYKRFIAAVDDLKSKNNSLVISDQSYLEYLQSKEFDDIFDYYDKNTFLTLWADSQGFPAVVTYTLRIIPPDTATQLKNKQINIVWKLVVSDINQKVNIIAPDNAKSIQDLIGANNTSATAIRSRDARRISDTKQIQLALELYFGANKANYPKSLNELAPTFIPKLPTDPTDKLPYRYTYYIDGTRTMYHLGASLEDSSNFALSSDRDCNSSTGSSCYSGKGKWNTSEGFNGEDAKGCRGETNRYCYDVIP